jgi:hypothetical protein
MKSCDTFSLSPTSSRQRVKRLKGCRGTAFFTHNKLATVHFPFRLNLSAWSHSTVFFTHNKLASAGLSAVETISRIASKVRAQPSKVNGFEVTNRHTREDTGLQSVYAPLVRVPLRRADAAFGQQASIRIYVSHKQKIKGMETMKQCSQGRRHLENWICCPLWRHHHTCAFNHHFVLHFNSWYQFVQLTQSYL